MTCTLFIGDYAHSSWSMRGWLAFDAFGLDVRPEMLWFSDDEGVGARMRRNAAPARTVPSARFDDGTLVWDSLALAEELASRFPDAGLWPANPVLRGLARSLAAEMHSGYQALRATCPMNTRRAYSGFVPSAEVQADLNRIEEVWAHAFDLSGGPWLCGEYSIADVFFAPVAARIAGFSLQVGEQAQSYVARHLADPAFRRWRAMGEVRGQTLPWYAQDLPQVPWPGPDLRHGEVIETGSPENKACPYSGQEPTQLMALEGHVWGFCNPMCRDKTAADPDAWPAFIAMEGG